MSGHDKFVKYPWGKLAVGESVEVYDVPSMASVYSSLRHWRDRCFQMGLGYDIRNCPQFRTEHDSALGSVKITRAEDGPLQSIARVERAAEERVKKEALRKKSELLDRLEWELSEARADTPSGVPLPLPSAEMLELAREVHPLIAERLAAMTWRRLTLDELIGD